MNQAPIVLSCEDVTLGYEHKPLLEHLTLTVRAGDYLCIVGENGSGKSTLLEGIAVACGSIPGATLGAKLIPKVPERQLRFLFGFFLIVAAAVLVLNEFGILG